MQYGDNFSNKPCARCQKAIGNKNLHYEPQGKLWFHKTCHDEGVVQLLQAEQIAAEARATEQAGRFQFPVKFQ